MALIVPGPGDRELGMTLYLTANREGTGGRIKSQAEDFIVREIPLLPAPKEGGRFAICSVTARNWETNRLVRELSRRLHISRSRVGFAGTKDKRGITTQYMSFEGVGADEVKSLNIKDVQVEFVRTASRGLSIGNLWGNDFEITIRDCDASGSRLEAITRAVADDIAAVGGFPNFFGVQRFGSLRPNTHVVGLRIVKKDFEGAVHAYAGNPGDSEEESVRRARLQFDSGGDISDILSTLPSVMTFEKTMLQHLEKHPGDYVGSLRCLPRNMLMMFVHALQGKLFNEIVCARLTAGLKLNVPSLGDIVLAARENGIPDRDRMIRVGSSNMEAVTGQVSSGFGFISAILFGWQPAFAEGVQGDVEREAVARSGLVEDDFVVPEIAECTSSGSRREILSPLRNMDISVDSNNVTLRFRLVKGSYATSMLREIMKS